MAFAGRDKTALSIWRERHSGGPAQKAALGAEAPVPSYVRAS